MKLYGNKSKPRQKIKARKTRGARIAAVLSGILALILLLVLGYMIWEKPPVQDGGGIALNVPPTPFSPPDTDDSPSSSDKPQGHTRNNDIYNILIAGRDQVGYNTDTILLVSLNTQEHTLDIISIPRDTMVNTPYNIKKVNQLCSYSIMEGKDSMDGLLDGMRDLLGFSVDAYALVTLSAVEQLVDTIGGVYYTVPVDMYYEAPDQNLSIAIPAGYQWLSGEDAVKVLRFRDGYADADIGRIGTQQDFLKSVGSQMLSLGNIPNLAKLTDIFTKNVDTSLSASNISFLAREFLKCGKDGIRTHTMPGNYNDSQGGFSYVTVDVDAWLCLVNEYINPWSEDITEDNVDILTRKNGMLYATVGTVAGGENSFLTMEQYLASLRGPSGAGAPPQASSGDSSAQSGEPPDSGGESPPEEPFE